MNRMMKGLVMLLCTFAFMTTMTMDGLAAMGSKPRVRTQGSVVHGGKASFTCSGDKCRCSGVEDCEKMVDSKQCTGGISCGPVWCTCDYFEPIPLGLSPKKFGGAQQ